MIRWSLITGLIKCHISLLIVLRDRDRRIEERERERERRGGE